MRGGDLALPADPRLRVGISRIMRGTALRLNVHHLDALRPQVSKSLSISAITFSLEQRHDRVANGVGSELTARAQVHLRMKAPWCKAKVEWHLCKTLVSNLVSLSVARCRSATPSVGALTDLRFRHLVFFAHLRCCSRFLMSPCEPIARRTNRYDPITCALRGERARRQGIVARRLGFRHSVGWHLPLV